jgi:peptidoglycan/LPS O-acetylase OafA/YrhL
MQASFGICAALLCCSIAVGVCALLSSAKSLRFDVPGANAPGRIPALDGLRGFLALGVFFSHAISYRQWYQTGMWGWPLAFPFKFSGQVAVMAFFGITGFLFWTRALKSRMAPARSFYKKRFLRIYPLYYAVLAISLAIAVIRSPHVSPTDATALRMVAACLILPGYYLRIPVHGLNLGLLITQTWSLAYEIVFYAALPLLAFLAPKRILRVVFYFAVLIALWSVQTITAEAKTAVSSFICGMVAADVILNGARNLFKTRTASICSILALAVAAFMPDDYTPLAIPALFVFFAPIAAGNDWFGFLSLRPCRLLGEITYSLYLLHLVVLYLVLGFVNRFTPVALMSLTDYWLVIGGTTGILTALSFAGFKVLEQPFIGLKSPRPS